MSVIALPQIALRRTLNIYENVETKTNIGEITLIPKLLYGAVKAQIQQKTSEGTFDLQGVTHYQTHTAYFNKYFGNIIREPKVGHIAFEPDIKSRFLILGVSYYPPLRGSRGGYYKLNLEKVADVDGILRNEKRLIGKGRII
jgi:hypothetical protein